MEMHESIQPPTREEEFDEIITIVDDVPTDKVLHTIIDTIERFSGIQLDCPLMIPLGKDVTNTEMPTKWI